MLNSTARYLILTFRWAGFLLAWLITNIVLANGETIYNEKCASCHENPTDPKVPGRDIMRGYYQSRVQETLTTGRMAPFVIGLNDSEIQEIVGFVTSRVADSKEIDQLQLCLDEVIDPAPVVTHWGVDKQNTRFQPDSTINAANVASLELKWAFGVPGSRTMRSYPAISKDTIFLPNTTGKLYAISRESGCVRWHFDAEGEIRTAAHLFEINGKPVISIGVTRTNVVILDALNGSLIHRENMALFQQSMVTGSQRAHNGQLFVPISSFDVALAMNPMYECCISHGGISAVNMADWSIRWTAHTTEDAKPTYKNSVGTQMHGPSGAPIWTTPAIDVKRNQLYIGTGENTSSPATDKSDAIIAYDLDTGAVKWVFQGTQNDAYNMACDRRMNQNCPKEKGPDFDFGASPILATTSKDVELVLAGQKSGDVWALNPDNGELVWQHRLSPGSALGGVHWGMTLVGDTLIVPIADPDFVKGANPGVFALDITSGELVWAYEASRACEFSGSPFRAFASSERPTCPWHYAFSAAPAATNDVAFAAALDGRVFAFNVENGEILWTYNTNREFKGINDTDTQGGSIDNPGIAIAGNQVIVMSGYDMFGQMAGNVMLTFELPSETATDG